MQRFRAAHLFVVVGGLLMLSCNERRESTYPDLAAARDSGELARGWLPSFLPQSTTSLHALYHVDAVRTLVAFKWDPREQFMRDAPCVPVAESEVASPPRFRGASWWPDSLRFSRRGGLRLFRCTEPSYPGKTRDAYLALDVSRGEAFFWRSGD